MCVDCVGAIESLSGLTVDGFVEPKANQSNLISLTNQLPPSFIPTNTLTTETERAAAAMDVHVGHFSDPDTLPGLAHFCEVGIRHCFMVVWGV